MTQKSPYLSVIEAQEIITAGLKPLAGERIALTGSMNRVLASPVNAGLDLPPFANSSVDGFAVRLADIQSAAPNRGVTLPVVMDVPAGVFPTSALLPGQAARVMTGAPVPQGADCVIPIEETSYDEKTYAAQSDPRITIFSAGSAGSAIRPQGQDIHKGEAVFSAGQVISAQVMGLLATLGVDPVHVYAQPKVAVLATGDELVAPNEPLQPGKIRESNGITLAALVARAGALPLQLPHAPDDPDEIIRRLDSALDQGAELIVTSAGVSVGAFDFVRKVIEDNGGLNFWRVNLRPGKPLAFGSYRGCPVIGLPGNPVSSFVGFHLFVLPAIQKLAGSSSAPRLLVPATLEEPVESDGRETYIRAILEYKDGRLTARQSGHQGSGNMVALVRSNALLILPSGVKSLPAGATITAWLIDG